jgi:multidrug efflux pump subunit AcrA (membrane-fusion protein)
MGEVLAGRRRWIAVAVAVVVLALIAYGVVHALTAGASEKPKAAATVAVDRGAVSTDVGTTGTVEPAQTRSLSFTVDGTVESVSVRAGSEVQAGQSLAKVDDSDAQQAVDDAQDALDEANQQLTDARNSSAKQTEAANTGTSTGCVAPAAYPVPVSASPTPSTPASSRPTTSPSRSTTPTRTGSPAPATSHSTGTGTRSGTGGTGSGTRGRTGGTAGGTCGGTGSGGTGSSGGGQGQQGGGTDAVLSAQQRVVSADTTLANAEDALEGATITAPIAGRILTVAGKVGSQVNSGSAFITLAGTSNMQINAQFPEADADNLKVGQAASVTLADQDGKTFKATVAEVDPTGTSDGTMVRYGVQLAFEASGQPPNLLVGQSAMVVVTTGSKAGVLRVPSTAVHDVAGTTGTVLKGGARVKVGIGLRGDQYTEITSGLSEGDQVVRSW